MLSYTCIIYYAIINLVLLGFLEIIFIIFIQW